MGAADRRHVGCIGGDDPLTSKVAIVEPSQRPGVDVDYLFAQVFVDQARVDYGQNCGNILAGVGYFAIEKGLVTPREAVTPISTVLVKKIGRAHVCTPVTIAHLICRLLR